MLCIIFENEPQIDLPLTVIIDVSDEAEKDDVYEHDYINDRLVCHILLLILIISSNVKRNKVRVVHIPVKKADVNHSIPHWQPLASLRVYDKIVPPLVLFLSRFTGSLLLNDLLLSIGAKALSWLAVHSAAAHLTQKLFLFIQELDHKISFLFHQSDMTPKFVPVLLCSDRGLVLSETHAVKALPVRMTVPMLLRLHHRLVLLTHVLFQSCAFLNLDAAQHSIILDFAIVRSLIFVFTMDCFSPSSFAPFAFLHYLIIKIKFSL